MLIEDSRPLNIKDWSPEDRPREKLLLKGITSLSDAELLAVLVGSGSTTLNAVDLAKVILQRCGNNLHDLAKLSVKDLMKVKGIGEAKAIAIVSAFELGRRRKELDPDEKPKINGSGDAFALLRHLLDKQHEEFWVLMLNRAHRVIRKYQLSSGGTAGTVVDPKLVFKVAIEDLAHGIILAHNHPSGNLAASASDLMLTKKLQEAGKLLEIHVLDHIIIGGNKYLSFVDEGLM
ncbi:MAG: RadC family protein [Bacteroidota bacterium]